MKSFTQAKWQNSNMKESVNAEPFVIRQQFSQKDSFFVLFRQTVFWFFANRASHSREIAEFCSQLAVLLRSKVSLHRSLEVLERQTRTTSMKQVIERLTKEIQKGNSFSRALSLQPDAFDSLFVVTAEVGQESGRLAEVLSDLARHLEAMQALKRKFTQALTYPMLVLTVALFSVLFLLVFIVPTFAEMFQSFQLELPVSTQFVLGLSKIIVQYGEYAALVAIIVVIFVRGILFKGTTKHSIESFALRLPFLGDLLLKNMIARFCRTLGTLLRAQVSLVDALVVAQRIISNKELKGEIERILQRVKQGSAVADPVFASRMFPPMVAQMIAVGEESSELDTMFLQVAEFYEKELNAKVEMLSSVIEPIIILFLGLVVATILISMYLPMFDLMNAIGTKG